MIIIYIYIYIIYDVKYSGLEIKLNLVEKKLNCWTYILVWFTYYINILNCQILNNGIIVN